MGGRTRRRLAAAGATTFLEGGPGDVLTKMAKRVVPGRRPRWRRLARGRRGRGKLRAVTRHATIAGVGSSLPPRLVPNTWFEKIVETNDEWIRDRTGIEARHFADDGVAGLGPGGRGGTRCARERRHRRRAARHDRRRHDHRRHRLPGHGGLGAAEAGRELSELRHATRRARDSATACRPPPRSSPRAWPTRSC